MPTLDVLVTGYAHEGSKGDSVEPTICLVRAEGINLVSDPGILANPGDLLAALKEYGLSASDISHVFLTHHHIDHTRNVGMFPTAVVYDCDSIYSGDLWAEHDGHGFELASGITIIHTPGHASNCASLIVETDQGKHVITHAWWFTDMTPAEDPMADDQDALEESRKKILSIADVVIPGHGAPFRVSR